MKMRDKREIVNRPNPFTLRFSDDELKMWRKLQDEAGIKMPVKIRAYVRQLYIDNFGDKGLIVEDDKNGQV